MVTTIYGFTLARQPIVDWDEAVYLKLAEVVNWDLSNYSTAGTGLDDQLPQAIYRSPIYHHPPLVPLLIKATGFVGFERSARAWGLVFFLASLVLVYLVARFWMTEPFAFLALFFWSICPIFHLEARLVHLDLPTAVFLLAGVLAVQRSDHLRATRPAAIAGLCFAAAMLCKYTGPLWFALPVLLAASTLPDWRGRPRAAVAMLATACLGFSWWLSVLVRLGSLMPEEFLGTRDPTDLTPYLQRIAERSWWDLPLYYLAIFPLFAVFCLGTASWTLRLGRAPMGFFEEPLARRLLVATLLAALAQTVVFGFVNASSNGYWTFRHILPLFPIVYLVTAVLLEDAYRRATPTIRSLLACLTLLSTLTLATSSVVSLQNPRNPEASPVALFWMQLDHLVH